MTATPSLLRGITVIDVTGRLPGPYASYLLSLFGAEIIKIENSNYPDPFCQEELTCVEPLFARWYERLNAGKRILKIDFDSPEGKGEILQLLTGAQVMLLGLPAKWMHKLGLASSDLERSINTPLGIVELTAAKDLETGMHDLNALHLCRYVHQSIQGENQGIFRPPALPFAGLAFGQGLALLSLATLIKARETKTVVRASYSLEESCHSFLGPLLDDQTGPHLHSGKFPCYCIYQSKDGLPLSVAAVEVRYWRDFCRNLELDLSDDERFSPDGSVHNILRRKLASKTAAEWKRIAGKNLPFFSIG